MGAGGSGGERSARRDLGEQTESDPVWGIAFCSSAAAGAAAAAAVAAAAVAAAAPAAAAGGICGRGTRAQEGVATS
jgi:hypothetical protein